MTRAPGPACSSEWADPVIGIDLGTTNTCVGVWDWARDSVRILRNDRGRRTTPSVVCFPRDGPPIVGDAALERAASLPDRTVHNAKRVIGRPYAHIRQSDIDRWPFRVVQAAGGRARYLIDEEEVSPEQVSAHVVGRMRDTAEAVLGCPGRIKKAVVTVPAYFTEPQKRATRDAGALAGLDVIMLLPEPIAAALAFGLDKKALEARRDAMQMRDYHVLVFDMGGGTFDVSVLCLDGRGSFATRAVTGDFHLGGEDFDDIVVDWVTEQVLATHPGVSISQRFLRRLRRACETAKRELSVSADACIDVPLVDDSLSVTLTQAGLNELCSGLFDRAMAEVESALDLAEIPKEAIQDVVLVGGSTRIPELQRRLREFFGGRELWCGSNPDEAVAWGAATMAAALSMASEPDSCPQPARRTEDTVLHPAAAAIPLRSVLLKQVTPITLGIELSDGSMDVLIPRATPVPTTKSDEYTTALDHQSSVVIKVYEGENTSAAKKNYLLGKFSLPVDDAPAGVPKIRVGFTITTEGLFLVCARNMQTQREVTVSIENTANLTPEERASLGIDGEQDATQEGPLASVTSARGDFRRKVIAAHGRALKAGARPEAAGACDVLLGHCVDTLSWLDASPEATATELAIRADVLARMEAGIGGDALGKQTQV